MCSNLAPKSFFTIVAHCKLVGQNDSGFQSNAYYVSDEERVINCDTMPSRGGTYEEIEPMGFIWSMESLQEIENARNAHLYRLRLEPDDITVISPFI